MAVSVFALRRPFLSFLDLNFCLSLKTESQSEERRTFFVIETNVRVDKITIFLCIQVPLIQLEI